MEKKIEIKFSEVNIRVVSRGQNLLIGEFKMAAGDVINIKGVCYEWHEHMILYPTIYFC